MDSIQVARRNWLVDCWLGINRNLKCRLQLMHCPGEGASGTRYRSGRCARRWRKLRYGGADGLEHLWPVGEWRTSDGSALAKLGWKSARNGVMAIRLEIDLGPVIQAWWSRTKGRSELSLDSRSEQWSIYERVSKLVWVVSTDFNHGLLMKMDGFFEVLYWW